MSKNNIKKMLWFIKQAFIGLLTFSGPSVTKCMSLHTM